MIFIVVLLSLINYQMEKYSINTIRHTLAHVMAYAVKQMFPETKFGIGPVIEDGFYYDFDTEHSFSDKDFAEIEKRMRKIIADKLPVEHLFMPVDEAIFVFKKNKQKYKAEILEEIKRGERPAEAEEDLNKEKNGQISFYKIGEFIDLCKGPHVSNTGDLPEDGFKLSRVAGAYWHGSEKNPQLQRIYALAFETKKELTDYETMLEEAKKRDHRKLGKELELFTIIDEIGPGLPLFYPKGTILRRIVENFITEVQEKRGYTPIWIPHITKGELYKISGHLDKYDAMYPPMKLKDEADYYLKPMNCPHFMMLYKSLQHSYRELPIRFVCTTTNYRYEKSGELSGLTRVRSLTQDDCHVFAAPEQVESEIELMLDMVEEVYNVFGFKDFWVRISTHDPKNREKYIGDPKIWEKSEAVLTNVIKKRGWKYDIGIGEAAFYGPKLDFIFKDVIGRQWQLSTIQLDMNLPERFDLEYATQDNTKARPIVIHRAILGSTERFLGILIEHFAGAFPLWLAPVQVAILPISDKQNDFANKVLKSLTEAGIRAEANTLNETLGRKIRDAELKKIPYLAVIGDKEIVANAIAVRQRGKGDIGQIKLEKFIEQLQEEISSKK